MSLLERLTGPEQLRSLTEPELQGLAAEIRSFLITSVCGTGGHLGPNLGVVELTIALHRVFDSPATPIVFDTGHQAYVHKLLTGRLTGFASLRQAGGLSGYPNRAESGHDVVENSHASTSLSYADGLSKAFTLAGRDRQVVAVIGDGALTGGLAWEALNNLAGSGRRVVIVLNDNGRSYAPTVGGLAKHLGRLQDRTDYRTLVSRLGGTPVPHGADGDLSGFFTALGLDYIGPVDGHDLAQLHAALTSASLRSGTVVVHCRTRKGAGYPPAETDEADRLHAVGQVEVATGHPAQPPRPSWTDAFSVALQGLADAHPEVVAVSAAMVGPTGLAEFANRHPERCFDAGIAEQHAVTSAAGLAMAGAHPVVAIYSTFAGRAFDQVLLDVGLHRLPVTLVLDRAGITGPDGPSHHGIWDLPLLGTVPGMRVAAPRDAGSLAELLEEAVCHRTGPTALRFPKGAVAGPHPAVERWRGIDVLRTATGAHVLVVAMGATVTAALEAARELADEGVQCTVVDPRWVLPANPALAAIASSHRLVVTVEDGVRGGGAGSRLALMLADHGCTSTVLNLGLPNAFLPQGDRGALLACHGLGVSGLVTTIRSAASRHGVRRHRSSPTSSGRRALELAGSRRWP